MRRKQKKDLKMYNPTELKDLLALNELRTFNDDELAIAMVQASKVEAYAIGLLENYSNDQTIVSIGMSTAWHARIVREVVAIQMYNRAQDAKGDAGTGQYL